jgi:hypothetical protein
VRRRDPVRFRKTREPHGVIRKMNHGREQRDCREHVKGTSCAIHVDRLTSTASRRGVDRRVNAARTIPDDRTGASHRCNPYDSRICSDNHKTTANVKPRGRDLDGVRTRAGYRQFNSAIGIDIAPLAIRRHSRARRWQGLSCLNVQNAAAQRKHTWRHGEGCNR